MNIVASIPVKDHLKTFALILENCEEDEVLDLKNGGVICYVLRMMLEGKMKMPDRKDYRLSPEYGASLQFKINSSMLDRGEISISSQNIIVFNQFLHKLLNELLLDRILVAREKYLSKEIDVIHDFLTDFEIEEQLESDTLKKSNYRLRKAKKIPGFTERCVLL
ncbi:hypothetical protein [Flavilitoribacter nigricans]|uniref:Uncharacterized protein n=1 Tax=Flavilitoribacter nigricans (strain ATCC 23147 / DSM 23189 / NBRC 102662 / NCIMB 1420 / SS-2) TaxID=1122177 RepID=A0A2D0NEX7_FLAN2|nr:hypothetical protein [Flavilitoribacter nigricans]PHN06958.1 hypothetical protein CRP01_09080 [Flavilitoribacter nigricans DSM 23189 = NBRC 102662]